MRHWLRGKRGGLVAFLAIAALVAGGLGWVTSAVLRLEQERIEARAAERAQADRYDQLRLALWTLDSRMAHIFGREESRPYNHYSAVYALSLALQNDGTICTPGSVLEVSPLLNAEIPDWMLLHFHVDREIGWESPQVLSDSLKLKLAAAGERQALVNATGRRQQLLADLARFLPPKELLSNTRLASVEPTLRGDVTLLQRQVMELNNLDQQQLNGSPGQPNPGQQQVQAVNDFANRAGFNYRVKQENPNRELKDDVRIVWGNTIRNGEGWLSRPGLRNKCSTQSSITLSPMMPLWLKPADGPELLLVARLVRIDDKEACQGILLDWPRLQTLLADDISHVFPDARIEPVLESPPPHPERTMTALPVQLDPGPVEVQTPEPGWTALRLGLALAWAAALVALGAVGLGGWSLIDLSERRIRFVSAVTHELRTPLTTLRLYLDMLTGGLVKEEAQKAEYLHTLNCEAERLNRLVGNVLDFSRLEDQQPRLEIGPVLVADLLEQVRSTWQGRCRDAGKELLVENPLGEEAVVCTDDRLVQQVLANLIDNACKYSRTADDQRIWLRARLDGPRRLVLEVEDRGPGIPLREARAIFRPFRRGRDADVTAGGVGLGLALAHRWAALLGGRLVLRSGPEKLGACFRLEIPFQSNS